MLAKSREQRTRSCGVAQFPHYLTDITRLNTSLSRVDWLKASLKLRTPTAAAACEDSWKDCRTIEIRQQSTHNKIDTAKILSNPPVHQIIPIQPSFFLTNNQKNPPKEKNVHPPPTPPLQPLNIPPPPSLHSPPPRRLHNNRPHARDLPPTALPRQNSRIVGRMECASRSRDSSDSRAIDI